MPEGISGHVIICEFGPMARYLIERFTLLKMPYFLVEEDVRKAAEYHGDGVSVIAGNVASPTLWADARVREAHGVVVNSNDARNTNITLTVRQESSKVPLVACDMLCYRQRCL